MVVSVIFATFENITKSLQHGFLHFFAKFGFLPASLQHFALQHLEYCRKIMQQFFASKNIAKKTELQKKGQCCKKKPMHGAQYLFFNPGSRLNTIIYSSDKEYVKVK